MNMLMNKLSIGVTLTAVVFSGCDPDCSRKDSPRIESLNASVWECSQWLSAKDAPVYDGAVADGSKAAPGTSWFVGKIANAGEVKSVRWMTAGLGVYEVYVNGQPVGCDFLKPGFTHNGKTKYSFTYDVTKLLKAGVGESNVFAAEVSAGWWRDKVVTPPNKGGGFAGRKSAFRGVLEFAYADGTRRLYGTNAKDWKAGISGPGVQAGIFDGEEYDARQKPGCECASSFKTPEVNDEFKGELLPMAVDAALPFGRDKVKDRTSGPACLSGITFEGG